MKKSNNKRVGLTTSNEKTHASFVIEVEKQASVSGNGYRLCFAGCITEKDKMNKEDVEMRNEATEFNKPII